MKEVTAQLNDYRQSPRKVRIVADAIRGKKILEAEQRLSLIVKRSSNPLQKLLKSALSNAKDIGISGDNLYVKSIEVNVGKILYRRRPVSRGSANPIRKRTSHVKIVLASKDAVKNKKTK